MNEEQRAQAESGPSPWPEVERQQHLDSRTVLISAVLVVTAPRADLRVPANDVLAGWLTRKLTREGPVEVEGLVVNSLRVADAEDDAKVAFAQVDWQERGMQDRLTTTPTHLLEQMVRELGNTPVGNAAQQEIQRRANATPQAVWTEQVRAELVKLTTPRAAAWVEEETEGFSDWWSDGESPRGAAEAALVDATGHDDLGAAAVSAIDESGESH